MIKVNQKNNVCSMKKKKVNEITFNVKWIRENGEYKIIRLACVYISYIKQIFLCIQFILEAYMYLDGF